MSEDKNKSRFDKLSEIERDRLVSVYIVTDDCEDFIDGVRCFVIFNDFTDTDLNEMWSHFDEMRATFKHLTVRGMRA